MNKFTPNPSHPFPKKKTRKTYLIVSNDGCARGVMTFAYFRKRLAGMKVSDRIRLQLSGLMTSKGLTPDPMALATLKKKGLEARSIRIEPLHEELLIKADVLVALSREDYHYVKNSFRSLPSQVRILQVPPIIQSQNEEAYEKTSSKIEKGIDQVLESWSGGNAS